MSLPSVKENNSSGVPCFIMLEPEATMDGVYPPVNENVINAPKSGLYDSNNNKIYLTTTENATSVGLNTSVNTNSTSTGASAFAGDNATSSGYTSKAYATDTIAIGVNSGASGNGVDKASLDEIVKIDGVLSEINNRIPPSKIDLNDAKYVYDSKKFNIYIGSYIDLPSSSDFQRGTPYIQIPTGLWNDNPSLKALWKQYIVNYITTDSYEEFSTHLDSINASLFALSSVDRAVYLDAFKKRDWDTVLPMLSTLEQKANQYSDYKSLVNAAYNELLNNNPETSNIISRISSAINSTNLDDYSELTADLKSLAETNPELLKSVLKVSVAKHYIDDTSLNTDFGSYDDHINHGQETLNGVKRDISDKYNNLKDKLDALTPQYETYQNELAKYNAATAEFTEKQNADRAAQLALLQEAAEKLGLTGTFNSATDLLGSLEGRSIAIGNQAYVSGTEAIGLGYGNQVFGTRSNVVGTHNTVSSANNNIFGNDNTLEGSTNNVILGNSISFAAGVATNKNVALGDNSIISAPVPTASMEIRGTTYNFAGTNPTSVVTVGSEGNERQIQNVAAGRVTETSTDAINGSQLYAVASAINSLDQRIPTQIADAIAADVAWSITTSSSEGGNVTGNGATEVANGDTVTIDAGKNINITQTGQTISIATSDTPTFNNVTINEAPTEGNHATTKDYVDNGRSVVEAGDNVKVEAKTDGATGKTTYTVSADVPTTTITKGDNVAVSENVDDSGNKTYTVNADKSIVSTTNDSGLTVSENQQVSDSGATTTTYSVELSDDTKAKLNKEESVTAGSDNLTVTQDSTNDTGGKNFVVDLAKNINLTEDGSLTIGNVKLSSTEVNAGGNVINNVAKGVEDNDAVNVAQLKDSRTKVVAGSNVEVVENEDTNTGALTYTINVQDSNTDKSAVVKAGDFVEVTTSQEANDGITEVTGYTVNVKTGSFETSTDGKLKAGDTNGLATTQDITNAVNETYWTVDVAGDTQNVKNGDTVKFGDGEFTEIALNDANEIVVDVKADGTTIINKDGALSVNLDAFGKTTLADGKNTTVTGEGTTNKPYQVNTVKSVTEAGSSNVVVNVNSDSDSLVDTYTVDLAKDINVNSVTTNKVLVGDISVETTGINAGNTKITNVANGTAPTDAVNLSQLNASKSIVEAGDKAKVESKTNADGSTTYTITTLTSEVKGGENVKVAETTGPNGQSIYTVSATGDLTNVTSISNGDTKVSLGDGIVNVEGNRITNVASPVEAGDAVNKDYVDNSHSTVTSTDGTISVVKSVVNATTGAVNYDLAVNGGIKVATDDGKAVEYKLGDTLTVTGDNKNISTVTTLTGATQVKLADDVKVNSVTTGDVSISTKGVNAGGKKVTNVAPAEINPTSTDAVNGSQLYATNRQVLINSANINRLGDNVNMLNNAVVNLGDRIENVEQRVGNVENKVNRMDRKRKAGTASAIATAGLMQAHRDGQSGVTAAVGQYQSQTAIAVGYSRLSDNGKYGVKLSLNANTQKEVGGAVGVGYFW